MVVVVVLGGCGGMVVLLACTTNLRGSLPLWFPHLLSFVVAGAAHFIASVCECACLALCAAPLCEEGAKFR